MVTASNAGAVSRPAPVPSRWRSLRQVSLRTCLGLLTLGCIWLAVVSQRAREQRLAVERIVALGGSVRYDYECDAQGGTLQNSQPPRWEWLRRVVGQGYFERVLRISLDESAVGDADMQVIGKLRGVKHLGLNETSVSDESLKQIRSWRQLNYLGLMRTRVTSAGLQHVEGLQSLDTLILERTNVDDDGMASIAKLRRLETLNLGGTQITSAAINYLCEMKKLGWLMLNGTRVSGEGLLQFRNALPDCQLDGDLVDLTDWPPDDVPDGIWLGMLKRLEALHSEDRLKLLDVSGVGIADRHLLHLAGFTNLQMLDLRETHVTDAGVESLRKSLPGCKIAR